MLSKIDDPIPQRTTIVGREDIGVDNLVSQPMRPFLNIVVEDP